MEKASDFGRRAYFQRRDTKLLKAMNMKHAEGRSKLRKKERAELAKSDMPVTPSDLSTHRSGPREDGKVVYSYGSAERGYVDIVVTPRSKRKPLEEGASSWK